MLKKPIEHWKALVLSDLKIAHPDIDQYISTIEIHRIAHGMISPVPNFLKSKSLKEASKNIDNKIFFAHSDLAGISIFEEAFHQGIDAAKKMLQ